MYEVKDIAFFQYVFESGMCTIHLLNKKKFNYKMSYDKFKETYHNYCKKKLELSNKGI